MTEAIVGIVMLLVGLGVAFLRGRSAGRIDEQKRSEKLAREVEQRRVEQARAEERREVDAAVERREDQKRRPGVDRANERLRRIVPIVLLSFLSAQVARAECRVDGADVACPVAEFDALMDQLDAAEAQTVIEKARSKRLDDELRALRDRASVQCPEQQVPLGPVIVTAAVGVLAAAAAFVAGFFAGGR